MGDFIVKNKILADKLLKAVKEQTAHVKKTQEECKVNKNNLSALDEVLIQLFSSDAVIIITRTKRPLNNTMCIEINGRKAPSLVLDKLVRIIDKIYCTNIEVNVKWSNK